MGLLNVDVGKSGKGKCADYLVGGYIDSVLSCFIKKGMEMFVSLAVFGNTM